MKKKYDFIDYLGFFLIFLSLLILMPDTCLELKAYSSNERKVTIIEDLPNNCTGYRNFCRFNCENKTFVLQVGNDFCFRYKNGDKISMKYAKFLFLEAYLRETTSIWSLLIDFIASLSIGLLGFYLIYLKNRT